MRRINRLSRSSTVQATHSGPSRNIHAFVLLAHFPTGLQGSLRPSCRVASFPDFYLIGSRHPRPSIDLIVRGRTYLLFHAIAIVHAAACAYIVSSPDPLQHCQRKGESGEYSTTFLYLRGISAA